MTNMIIWTKKQNSQAIRKIKKTDPTFFLIEQASDQDSIHLNKITKVVKTKVGIPMITLA